MIVVLAALLLLACRRREGFFGGALPPGTDRQKELSVDDVALAADQDIPVRLGALQPQPFKYQEVKSAMACAVELINRRCKLDLVLLGVDGADKSTDAVKNVQLSGDVHVYSQATNCSVTLAVVVLGSNGGRRYLRSVTRSSVVDPGTSGVTAAPTDVFDQEFSPYENFI